MARTLTLATAVTWLVWATSISAQVPASSAASAAAAAPKRDLTGVWMIRFIHTPEGGAFLTAKGFTYTIGLTIPIVAND